jgi:hypothetical protein
MVRREEKSVEPRSGETNFSCCIVLAGASPARVTAAGSGSRRQRRGEIRAAERRVESLFGGSKGAGRNPLNAVQASSDYQPKGDWECRAGHVAAKATHSARSSAARALGLPGVVAAARSYRTVRNTREPSRQLTSSKDRAHKARAESARSRAAVRGARSTDEGGDNPLEGRGPALVVPAMQVSARACP